MSYDFLNIIVRMPNWIGDAVMATPILHDLRAKYLKARITVMCQAHIATLLLGNPHIDEIFSFSRPNEFLRRQEKRNILTRLRQGKYDLGVLLTGSFSSALWFWRGNVEKRLGFATDWRRLLLTDAIPKPKLKGKEHLVDTYKRLLEPLGIPHSETSPELFIQAQERDLVREILRQRNVDPNTTLIGINPGAAYGSAKCWLPDRFRAITERLLQNPSYTILYFGDAAGTSLVKEICGELPVRVVNLAGLTTLRELMALISLCTVFLTNDSGPMHIAAALKIPLLALFGSTNEIATGPYKHGRVIHKHVDCSPCYKRVCPIDFRCMKRIEVDEVYEAITEMLRAQGK